MTNRRRRGKMALSQRNRGGRAGTHRNGIQCNIPSHMTGERIAENAELQSQDILASQRPVTSAMRLDRMLRRQHSANLNRRRAAALAVGAATIAVATRALPRSRTFPKFRVAKRAFSRFPKVVGVPRSRTPTQTGVRRGSKGGAFRFPRFADFPRKRRVTRPRFTLTGPRSGGPPFFTQEEGF